MVRWDGSIHRDPSLGQTSKWSDRRIRWTNVRVHVRVVMYIYTQEFNPTQLGPIQPHDSRNSIQSLPSLLPAMLDAWLVVSLSSLSPPLKSHSLGCPSFSTLVARQWTKCKEWIMATLHPSSMSALLRIFLYLFVFLFFLVKRKWTFFYFFQTRKRMKSAFWMSSKQGLQMKSSGRRQSVRRYGL